MITHYRRSLNSPWVSFPSTNRASVQRFLSLGTWFAYIHEVAEEQEIIYHD